MALTKLRPSTRHKDKTAARLLRRAAVLFGSFDFGGGLNFLFLFFLTAFMEENNIRRMKVTAFDGKPTIIADGRKVEFRRKQHQPGAKSQPPLHKGRGL